MCCDALWQWASLLFGVPFLMHHFAFRNLTEYAGYPLFGLPVGAVGGGQVVVTLSVYLRKADGPNIFRRT